MFVSWLARLNEVVTCHRSQIDALHASMVSISVVVCRPPSALYRFAMHNEMMHERQHALKFTSRSSSPRLKFLHVIAMNVQLMTFWYHAKSGDVSSDSRQGQQRTFTFINTPLKKPLDLPPVQDPQQPEPRQTGTAGVERGHKIEQAFQSDSAW